MRKHQTFIILTILTFLFIQSNQSLAQDYRRWHPEDGVGVRQGSYIQGRATAVQTEGDFVGDVAFTWTDCRNGQRSIYLQVIESGGNLRFEENGKLITPTGNTFIDQKIYPCSDGGWFVVWVDDSADTLGNILCTRINAGGERRWDEDENGTTVVHFPGRQTQPRAVSDGEDGFIIFWQDQRNDEDGDIYAQRILADGTRGEGWGLNGNAIVRAMGAQASFQVCSDSEGGAIAVWMDGRSVRDDDICAQRVNREGDLLWGNGDRVIVCGNEFNQESPVICPDGNGGVFVAWADTRNINQTNRDVYVQRLDRNGRELWTEADEGIPLCTARGEQVVSGIVATEDGNAVVMWSYARIHGSAYDLSAMHISGEDRMIRDWEHDQDLIISDGRNAAAVPDGDGGFFLTWQDETYEGPDIWAQRFNRNGDLRWGEDGVVVCGRRSPEEDGLGYQGGALINNSPDGGCSIIWSDNRSDYHLYSQLFTADGEPICELNGFPVVEGISGDAQYPDLLSRGNGEFVLTWTDNRGQRSTYTPYMQICRDAGNRADFMLGPNGQKAVNTENINTRLIESAQNDNGDVFMVWEDYRENHQTGISVQKVSANGVVQWDSIGVRLGNDGEYQDNPKLCDDGSGGVILLWESHSENEMTDIVLQRLDNDGNRLWGGEGFLFTETQGMGTIESVMTDGEGGAVFVWTVYDPEFDSDLWIGCVNANGESLWGGDGRVLCREYHNQRNSVLVRSLDGYFVVWEDSREDVNGEPVLDVYGQFIEQDGTFRWTENGYCICDSDLGLSSPAAAVDNDGNIWIAWNDAVTGYQQSESNICLQKLNPEADEDGNPPILLTDEDGSPARNGIIAIAGERYQGKPQIVHDGNNGVWLAWADFREAAMMVYATHLQPDGTLYQGWAEDGNLISEDLHPRDYPRLTLLDDNGSNGVVVAWRSYHASQNISQSDIYIQRLDDDMIADVVNRQELTPTGFQLNQAYPNPFNSRTVISCYIPKAGRVRLSLYDVTGRLVGVLSDDWKTAGDHRLAIDAEGLAAGEYVVRMMAGEVIMEKGIVLIK